MSEANADKTQTPYDDPNVKAAMKGGREPSDIALIDCPNCGMAGYYNQGSHFSCRICQAGYACITEDEDAPLDRPYIVLGEEYTLADWNDAVAEEHAAEEQWGNWGN